MKRSLIAALSILFSIAIAPSANAKDEAITVMSRNLYLGADVGVAMNLLPDFPAATQFMWDQMRQTDFPNRSKKFAKEIALANPDVIGIQEATNWYCQKNLIGENVVTYDFTNILLSDLESLNLQYEIASKDGKEARNVGFEIKPIPLLTKAYDPETFKPLFGQDFAYCGFEIADVLLIKSTLSEQLLSVGTVEYEAKYTIIPTLMTIYRGYSWADLNFNGTSARFVTTHLESLFDEKEIPVAKLQADQLVEDLKATKIPIVVMGDFNSDPRDPRPSGDDNPGGQPVENEQCKGQLKVLQSSTGDASCNPYWTMINAGFENASVDAISPSNYTWGLNALLTGPDESRLPFAKKMGNNFGFTDRLDYIFIKGDVQSLNSKIIGNLNPKNSPSDHAGIVSTIRISGTNEYREAVLNEHARFPIGFWKAVGIFLSIIALLVATLGIRIKMRSGNFISD